MKEFLLEKHGSSGSYFFVRQLDLCAFGGSPSKVKKELEKLVNEEFLDGFQWLPDGRVMLRLR